MSNAKRTFVDSHFHLWDSTANPWYEFPVPGNDWGLGLTKEFPDRFLVDEYRQSTASLDVAKAVYVTAATYPKDAPAESAWIEKLAPDLPFIKATVGTVDTELPFTEIEAMLDRDMASPRFRGIRLLYGMDYETSLADQLLGSLSRRGLVYDAVTHFDQGIAAAAAGLSRYEDLAIVLEHCGWPAQHDADAFGKWYDEMKRFAALPNANCKLSGVGMWVHKTDLRIFSSYFRACIDLFGPDRCMFGSNLPVDLSYGDPARMFAVFEDVAAQYTQAEQAQLFETTAERVYRI